MFSDTNSPKPSKWSEYCFYSYCCLTLATLGFTLSTSQSGDTSGELLPLCEFIVRGGILITSKKPIHSKVVASRPGRYCVSVSVGLIKWPKNKTQPIIITGTSFWTVLACIYLPALLPDLQVSYCSFGKPEVSLNTISGEKDSSWQGCPDPRLKLKTGTVLHCGDEELLNAAW